MNSEAHYEKPLSLLFYEFEMTDFNAILSSHNDIIMRQSKISYKYSAKDIREEDQNVSVTGENDPTEGQIASWNLQFEGVELNISWQKKCKNIHDYNQIFCNIHMAATYSLATISLGSHVKEGRKNPAVIASLFRLARELITAAKPIAVMWNVSQTMTDPNYFADAVDHYANGGPFPILSTINFMFENDKVHTLGLAYFSNQEICYSGPSLNQSDAMKRVMRIVHDVAANGAYTNNIEVSGLEPNEKIAITLNDDIVQARSIF